MSAVNWQLAIGIGQWFIDGVGESQRVRAVHFGEDGVEGIGGFEEGDAVVFGGGGADGDGEEFVAAVEGEDVVGGEIAPPQDFGGGFAEGLAGG